MFWKFSHCVQHLELDVECIWRQTNALGLYDCDEHMDTLSTRDVSRHLACGKFHRYRSNKPYF